MLGSGTWVILLATVVALLVAWALKMTAGTANQVAISALLVLALGTATPSYALDRVLETLIGAVIGILVNLALVPPVAVAPARDAVTGLGDELANSLERLAGALETRQSGADLNGLLRRGAPHEADAGCRRPRDRGRRPSHCRSIRAVAAIARSSPQPRRSSSGPGPS